MVMAFNAIFNNISVLLVMETGVSAAGHWQTLSHNVVSSTLKIIWLILKYVIKSMIEFGYYIIEHFAWMNLVLQESC
jgi:hypothetical protein